ncbi:THO complex subunit 4 [Raphidocelis subcapitata]|uniref:THO complex subunit 4 n=1 Tax=Raphidocelis subcapitata TaxID=307507 RepID=A0A2V0PAK5_9CHLO|nr:THO complex subunit 4 [Raphidocelis subcapitata]|eukprot:GBF94197.1 THO complex subunit 4 [Raphidocelis subcapitata]
MADTKLDMSLDELIAKQAAKAKSAAPKGKGKPAGGKPGAKPPARGLKLGVNKARGGGVTKASGGVRAPLASAAGRQQQQRGGGGGGRGVITIRNPAAGRGRPPAPMPVAAYGAPPRPRGRPPMDAPPAGKWRHDLYNPVQAAGPAPMGPAPVGGRVIKNKLFVSNLDFAVCDADIKELFESCGTIKEAGIHYDKGGRSKGTAHIVFERAEDALKAFQNYNNVALDGKRLNIELVETTMPPGTLVKLSSGISVTAAEPAYGGGGGGGGGFGGGAPGGGFSRNRPRSVVRGRGAPGGGADAMQE